MEIVRWKSTRLRLVMDAEKTSDYDVEVGIGGHLPILLDY